MTWLRAPASQTQITHGSRIWLYGVAGVVMAFLVLPTLIVIPMSFSASQYLEFPPQHLSLRWYEAYLASPKWLQATATSLKVGALTMLLTVPLGTMAAYGLVVSRSRWARAVRSVLLTPILVPVILVAIGVFYVYVKLGLVNTMVGLVVAHGTLALPLVVMVVTSALQSFDLNQEMVARSLGASRLRAFWLVTLPQVRFAIVTSAVLAFLTSFDEVVVAMFISGGDNATLTRAMFDALRDQIDPTIAAISTVMIVSSSVLVVVSQLVGRSRRSTV
jgi:putative spermidine/putrescine transport system permease protein